MKRTATYLMMGGLVGVLGFTSVALAQEATLYGSVRSGIVIQNPDSGDSTWDIGSVDGSVDHMTSDVLFSRIGVRASYDLGNNMSSGLHIEKRLDNFRTRHQNVWLQGSLGRVTLGQQSSPFYGAVTWDGANFTGGIGDPGSRVGGISYGTQLDGPFNFQVMVRDDNSVDGSSSTDVVDNIELAASFDAGVATISLGYIERDDNGPYSAGAAVGGAAGAMSWKVGYQTNEDVADYYGFHLGYGIGSGNAYLQYDNVDPDIGSDTRATIVGYSHLVGTNTRIIGEHRNVKDATDTTIVALRIDF